MIVAAIVVVIALWISFGQLKQLLSDRGSHLTWFLSIWILSLLYSLAGALIFTKYYPMSDFQGLYHDALILAQVATSRPALLLELFDSRFEHLFSIGLYYAQSPRAVYAAALFSPIAGICQSVTGSFLVIASINILTSIAFCAELVRKYRLEPGLLLFVFILIPSVSFWHVGFYKEALTFWLFVLWLLISFKWVKAAYLHRIFWTLCWLAVAYVLYKLKYYIAFSGLFIIAATLIDLQSRNGKWRLAFVALGSMVLLYFVLQPWMHHNLQASRIFEMVRENHKVMLSREAQGSSLAFNSLDGNLSGFYLSNFPLAAYLAWFGPLPFGASSLFLLLAGMERLAFLALLMVLVYLDFRKKINLRPSFISICWLSWAMALGLILAYATPNQGALFRYQSLYFPVFWLLLLLPLQREGYLPFFKQSPEPTPIDKKHIHEPPGMSPAPNAGEPIVP
jgi:hypothetical protein